jgi:predicted dinucleotide-binding enzyme
MRIGIVGSDDRARAIGRLLHTGGHHVTFGDPASSERAERAAREVGSHAEPPYEQAMHSDLLFFAVPGDQVDRAVTAVGSTQHAVVVDAISDGRPTRIRSGAEMLARKLDSHRVVRALIGAAMPGSNIPICGDDPSAKVLVNRALQSAGCLVTDRGPLSSAKELEAPA